MVNSCLRKNNKIKRNRIYRHTNANQEQKAKTKDGNQKKKEQPYSFVLRIGMLRHYKAIRKMHQNVCRNPQKYRALFIFNGLYDSAMCVLL